MEILEISQNVKNESEILLKETGLLEFLSNFGETKIVGSCAYDLMMARDLDISVVIPGINTKLAYEIFEKLMHEDKFQTYKIADFYSGSKRSEVSDIFIQKAGLPDGFFIGLRYWIKKEMWGVDIWLTKEDNNPENYYSKVVINKLNEEKRKTILEFKDWRIKNMPKLRSNLIYEAVLIENIDNIDDLLKYAEPKI